MRILIYGAGRLSPCKMNIFRFLPLPIMTIMLAALCVRIVVSER